MAQILHYRYWLIALTGGLLTTLIVCIVFILPLWNGIRLDSVPKVYPTSQNPKDFYGRVFGKTRTEEIKQTALTSSELASELAGFLVLTPRYLPDDMTPAITILVYGSHAYRVEVNFQVARDLLRAAGLPTDAISAQNEPVQVMATIAPSAAIHQGHGERWFTLIQARNPKVNAPQGFDQAQLGALGELGLQFLGLDPAEARQVSQRMNWASMLVLPPADMTLAERVSINGHSGYMLRTTTQGIGNNALLWEADGVLYGIYGGLTTTELAAIAESLR
jgi:hypothetical protein